MGCDFHNSGQCISPFLHPRSTLSSETTQQPIPIAGAFQLTKGLLPCLAAPPPFFFGSFEIPFLWLPFGAPFHKSNWIAAFASRRGFCWRTFKTATTATNSSKISQDRQKCNSTFFKATAMTQKCNSTFFQATATTATNSSKISQDRQNVTVHFSKLP